MRIRLADRGGDAGLLEMDASEAATQTLGALAAKGKGKSYLAGKFVEQLHAAGCPFVVIEPVGNWWTLALGKDGKSPGLPIVVIGGDHAHVEVEPDQGAAVGRFLVESDGSAVIDVSRMSKKKRKEFVADFCEAFYRASADALRPRMLVLEEAQAFAPQHAQRGEERMLGAVTDIVRLGRNYGIGSMLVSQRPQSVSKEVLNMVECLFVGGMRGPHERKAIAGWVTEVADGEEKIREQLGLLPRLDAGHFLCWSPSWLRLAEVVHILPKETFDGTSTPRLGERIARTKLPELDVAALRAALAPKPPSAPKVKEGSGPSKADRPSSRSETLGRDLAAALDRAMHAEAELRRLEDRIREYDAGIRQIHAALDRLLESTAGRATTARRGNGADHDPSGIIPPDLDGVEAGGYAPRPPPVRERPPRTDRSGDGGSASGDYQTDLLRALACYGASTRQRLSLVSGKSRTSSTFAAALRALKAAGLIEENGGTLAATKTGRKAAGDPRLPKGDALFHHWCDRLGEYDRRNFQVLAGRKTGLTRAELSDKTGHSRTSSSFAASLRRLKGLGLVIESGGLLGVSGDARETMGL